MVMLERKLREMKYASVKEEYRSKLRSPDEMASMIKSMMLF